jgi:hypothetical protein
MASIIPFFWIPGDYDAQIWFYDLKTVQKLEV